MGKQCDFTDQQVCGLDNWPRGACIDSARSAPTNQALGSCAVSDDRLPCFFDIVTVSRVRLNSEFGGLHRCADTGTDYSLHESAGPHREVIPRELNANRVLHRFAPSTGGSSGY